MGVSLDGNSIVGNMGKYKKIIIYIYFFYIKMKIKVLKLKKNLITNIIIIYSKSSYYW